MKIQTVCQFMESFAPMRLAEDWDNVGLIAGDRQSDVSKLMVCLTVTPESVDEAIAQNADLIVAHHPLPFRPIKKLTTDSVPAGLLWKLARAGISVYSPHTSFDSAAQGINASLAAMLGVQISVPLAAIPDDPDGLGAGRCGRLDEGLALSDLVATAKRTMGIDGMHVVGSLDQSIRKLAVACGSGGSFLNQAKRSGCDVLVTGEATFHTCLDAKAKGVGLVLLGHYASERFAVEGLAKRLQAEFAELFVWASEDECDPLVWI